MRQLKGSFTKNEVHIDSNCFLFAMIGTLKQGWLLDTNRLEAFTLDEVTAELCAVPTLSGKPKVILIEEYGKQGISY